MAITYGDIKSRVWGLLGQKSTSTSFSPTIVGDAINNRILDFLRWKITSLLDPNKIYSTGRLWLREGSTYIRTTYNTALTQWINIGDTTIYCNTTNLSTSWWIEVGGEQISYTWKTWTTLTGCSAAQATHESGITVVQLYSMPSNFEKPLAVYYISENGWRTAEIPLDEGSQTVYYTLFKKTTANLVRITGLDPNTLIEMEYSKSYTPMTSDSDVCILPDHYWDTVIGYLVAGELGLDKGIPNAQNHLIRAYANLQNCYQYFNSESWKPVTSLKPKSYNFSSLRRWRTTR